MVQFKILNTNNICFQPDLINKMELLYDGGYKIMQNASLFLPKLSIESAKSHKERLQCASYLPYLAEFVNHFASNLFSDDLTVNEAVDAQDGNTLGGSADESFYKVFAANCDEEGTSLHNFMHDLFDEALYCPCAYVGVDFKNVDSEEDQPENLLEEEMRGLSRAYLYCIDPKTVIDWKINKANQKFDWIKLKNDVIVQDDPLLPPQHKVQFKLWIMQNGLAAWKLFESKLMDLNKQPLNNDDIPLVSQGITSFREIPIFKMQITDGLHIGNKLGPICEELFQRRSFLVSNMNKTCISIPVVKLGPEISAPGEAMPSDVQQNPNRGFAMQMDMANKGYTVIGAGDDIVIREASGASHALVDKQLNELIEKMHELIAQMANSVANNSKALGRSGQSKQEDRAATEILLSAYSRICKDFIKEIYNCIASARGESVVWVVSGLTTFVEEDKAVLMAEALAVAGKEPLLNVFPSPTLHKKWLLKLGKSFVGNLSEEEEAQIQQELEDAVDSGDHLPPDPEDAAQINAKAAGKQPQSGSNSSNQPDSQMELGDSGHQLAPEGAHLQTGIHIDPEIVHNQLSKDYDEKYIKFVMSIPWVGPQEVPISSIDFSNEQNWEASKRTDKIKEFQEIMDDNDTQLKPIILVNEMNTNGKFIVLDGHTRSLAAKQAGKETIVAYIGQVGRVTKEMKAMHSMQDEGEAGGNRVKSNQTEKSNQVQ